MPVVEQIFHLYPQSSLQREEPEEVLQTCWEPKMRYLPVRAHDRSRGSGVCIPTLLKNLLVLVILL